MSEIIKPIEKLPEGIPYTPGADEYLITEAHTFSDVARWIIAQGGTDEVVFFLTEKEPQ